MAKVVKTFRCDPDLWARVAARAAAEQTNVSAVIVDALERYADGDARIGSPRKRRPPQVEE